MIFLLQRHFKTEFILTNFKGSVAVVLRFYFNFRGETKEGRQGNKKRCPEVLHKTGMKVRI